MGLRGGVRRRYTQKIKGKWGIPSGLKRADVGREVDDVLISEPRNNGLHDRCIAAITSAAFEVINLTGCSGGRTSCQWRKHISHALQPISVARGAWKSFAGIARLRQQLPSLYASGWHVSDESGRRIA